MEEEEKKEDEEGNRPHFSGTDPLPPNRPVQSRHKWKWVEMKNKKKKQIKQVGMGKNKKTKKLKCRFKKIRRNLDNWSWVRHNS